MKNNKLIKAVCRKPGASENWVDAYQINEHGKMKLWMNSPLLAIGIWHGNLFLPELEIPSKYYFLSLKNILEQLICTNFSEANSLTQLLVGAFR